MNEKRNACFEALAHLAGEERETDYMAIYFFDGEEIEEVQHAFYQDDYGNPVEGWQENWFAVGIEGDTDDPIFVDVNQDNFPVYTVMLEGKKWMEPILIFSTIYELVERYQS